jgi:N-acetylmuramoyl-L-alanine amidase
LSLSQRLAQVAQAELAKIPGLTVGPPATAPIRVLRSVNAPAVAVEVGSLAGDVDSSALTSLSFQEEFANAIVRAIDTFQGGRS